MFSGPSWKHLFSVQFTDVEVLTKLFICTLNMSIGGLEYLRIETVTWLLCSVFISNFHLHLLTAKYELIKLVLGPSTQNY